LVWKPGITYHTLHIDTNLKLQIIWDTPLEVSVLIFIFWLVSINLELPGFWTLCVMLSSRRQLFRNWISSSPQEMVCPDKILRHWISKRMETKRTWCQIKKLRKL
jgi:hypothetical protein